MHININWHYVQYAIVKMWNLSGINHFVKINFFIFFLFFKWLFSYFSGPSNHTNLTSLLESKTMSNKKRFIDLILGFISICLLFCLCARLIAVKSQKPRVQNGNLLRYDFYVWVCFNTAKGRDKKNIILLEDR